MAENWTHELRQIKQRPWEGLAFLAILSVLLLLFLFQQHDWLGWLCGCRLNEETHFVSNKTIRLLLNDVLMLGLIHLWFKNRAITRLALILQLVDTVLLLPLYLTIKLMIEGPGEISSPLLSQFHRLIVNPTLMILVFPAIYLQRLTANTRNSKNNR